MRKYYLFFERPKGSCIWSQTHTAGYYLAHHLTDEQEALTLKKGQDAMFPDWQHEIRVVELPAEKAA